MARVLFAIISLWSLSACEAPTRAEQVCARLEECLGPGETPATSVCIDYVITCVESLPAPERAFWEEHMDGCFDLDSCPAFGSCWGQVSQC